MHRQVRDIENNVNRRLRMLLAFVMLLLLTGCNTLKFVPEDQYLLDNTKIEVTDTKEVKPSELKPYLRQTQNSKTLGFWKLQLHIYNTAPLDTTTKSKKRLARNARKMGEAPEIFDAGLASQSMTQLTKALQNRGFFNATVDTSMAFKGRKLTLTYHVHANEPYYLRNAAYYLPQGALRQYAMDKEKSLLKEGMYFNSDVLNQERARLEREMRRSGYYYFERSLLQYTADSTIGDHQVDVEMKMQDYYEDLPDTLQQRIFARQMIRDVYFHLDYDPNYSRQMTSIQSSEKDNYHFTWVNKKLLRDRTLIHTCEIKPGDWYDIKKVEDTYANFNSLGVVKYVDISFKEYEPGLLDCHIVISRRKLNTFTAEVEGTYSAGDWGVAAGVGYVNKNIFRGAEELSLKVRGGYEWRQNGGRAIEARAQAGLKFPNRLKINLAFNYQQRPDEFTRTIVNASLGWSIKRPNSPWTHQFSFVDLSLVYLPYISDEFRSVFLQPTNILKYSYEDHLILGLSYSLAYTSFREKQPLRSFGNFRARVEVAGNVMDGIARLAGVQPGEDGMRQVLGICYSQYFKADFDFAYHQIFNEKHRLVFHGAIGCAIPYGNSKTIPFEKRYFAGGGNSVRGWTMRGLGPGSYKGLTKKIDYNNRAGDLKLDLNVEYRWKVWNFIELAAFTDAGNIWTIDDYDNQPGGGIKKDFYKQIAWSYGVGLRLDFTVFVFRIDYGIRLYDPEYLSYDAPKAWRTAPNGLGWNDMSFHFAIGYPF